MRFALVDGRRQEAQPHLLGDCPGCGRSMVARCGEVRVHHWAHKGQLFCDPWWENETEWHRAWKDQFPTEWQEVIHPTEDGGRHIADVKTVLGWVIEFQHSYLNPEERRLRDAFYPKLIWVVDGARRKRDQAQLMNAWNAGVAVGRNSPVRKVFTDECRLLREWTDCKSPVFFDLGDRKWLWWLFAKSANGWAYIASYPRALFIEGHRSTAPEIARQFEEFVNEMPKLIAAYESHIHAQPSRPDPLQPRGARRHFRF